MQDQHPTTIKSDIKQLLSGFIKDTVKNQRWKSMDKVLFVADLIAHAFVGVSLFR